MPLAGLGSLCRLKAANISVLHLLGVKYEPRRSLIMNAEAKRFFAKMPETLPLYESIEAVLLSFHDVKFKVHKTQISFYAKRLFAAVWLPIRPMKNRPDNYIILTLALHHRIDSPRIAEVLEPYPRRWTHHIIISDSSEIDPELKSWIDQAYQFARSR
jgi:hypothetical protein